MKILFLMFTALFCTKSNFRKIFFKNSNDSSESNIISDYTRFLNNTNNTSIDKEGYDETYVRNETKEIEDIQKIKDLFTKLNLIKILENKRISKIHKLEVLKKYESNKIDDKPGYFDNYFFKDILYYEF